MTTPLSTLNTDAGENTLSLCLHRLHGRRVGSSAVPVPPEGLVLGADSLGKAGLALHYGALHIAPTHAVVRTVDGNWVLEPGCRDMLVALNDEAIPWGDSRPLHPGDHIDLGFASLRVEGGIARVVEGGIARVSDAAFPLPAAHAEAPVSPPAAPALSLLELADIQVADFPEFSEQTVSPDAPDTLPNLAPPTNRTTPADQMRPPGRANPLAAADDANDPLAALAAESARVLAGKSLLSVCGLSPLVSVAPSETPAAVAVPAVSPLPPPPIPERDPLQDLPTAASLEEILEGPLSIDDVLDGLKRAHPHTAPATIPGAGLDDPLAALSGPEPVPDPLLLLAGVGPLPAREPELAPVLHREHRTTGLTSPYRFTVAPNPEDPTEEDPWPLPIR